ncbi:TfoX/Sxy family protein [Devosia sp. WQ 349]|uniref:TfoX/Sxy family protein n=1 Tax=Devosia sp. WQ 349K1 TaxID=2800329 RepID=UPI001904A944|nr:TfoX/Sxy family protein [Devosia sp. WQ 349K1]MBK1793628.1 TfoX/Sxy family protein [Devosia sp. WQ 349K1]
MSMAMQELLDRLEAIIPPSLVYATKKMFGGTALMVRGHMALWAGKEGNMLVRVGKTGMETALKHEGTSLMEMTGRTMGGFVLVSGDVLEDEETLAFWLQTGLASVQILPPK